MPTAPLRCFWTTLSALGGALLGACAVSPGAGTGARVPYPPSALISGMKWDLTTVPSLRSAYGSDIWPTAWAPDGNLYAAWGDGGGFDGTEDSAARGRVSLGFARISGRPMKGRPDSYVGRNVWGMQPFAERQASFGGKVGDLISIDGVLYGQGGLWTTANCDCRDPTQKPESGPARTLTWSEDLGESWQIAPWTSDTDLGATLQFGQDYAGALDPTRVFLYYQRDVASDPSHVYLRRVRRGELRIDPATAGHFEYFAGTDGAGAAIWSGAEAAAVPVFTDARMPRGSYASPSVVYDAALGRYLLTAYHGNPAGMVGFFEAPAPWGPWRTIAYYQDWGGFNKIAGEGNGVSFPAKWISADGRELWAVFSGLRTSAENYFDSFNLAAVRLTLRQSIPALLSPSAASSLPAGEPVTAAGAGSRLSWLIERLQIHSGELRRERIASGAGKRIRFTTPAQTQVGEWLRITLTSDANRAGSRSVFRDFALRPP